jgi:transcription elongation factor Elf1
MDPHVKTIVECPFCQKETLEVLTWPAHTEFRSSRSAVAKSTTAVKKSEGFELLSQRCSNCGQNANAIKKVWKEGIPVNSDKRRRRLEELKKLGFSGVIH